jgi:hypothetical protein
VRGRRFGHGGQQRDRRRHALDREPLRPDVASLENLFEDLSLRQPLADPRLIELGGRGLDLPGDPQTAVRVGAMHEFGADRAAVDRPRRLRIGSLHLQLGVLQRLQPAERVEVGLQIAPAAERIADWSLGKHDTPSDPRSQSATAGTCRPKRKQLLYHAVWIIRIRRGDHWYDSQSRPRPPD